MRPERRRLMLALTMVVLSATAGSEVYVSAARTPDSPLTWNFDTDLPGALPKDFSVGTLFDGRPAGDWKVLQTAQAKSPSQVLAQVQGKGAEHAYKVILLNGIIGSDVDLEVSFLPIEGKGDMGGGLIWRAADDRNYYLTRANPLEQNIRIYRVVKGVRHLLHNFDQTIGHKKWHTLRASTHGCHIQVYYDQSQVFDLCDQTFRTGRIGLWTKSDAVTYFDDLRVTVLK